MTYLDHIIVYSKDTEQHRQHVRGVIQDLLQADCRLRTEKCEFNTERCEYLGFVIQAGKRVAMDNKKVQAIKD